MRSLRFLAFLLFIAPLAPGLFGLSAPSSAVPAAPTLDFAGQLVLKNALFREAPGVNDPSLLVELRRSEDRWLRPWGIARSFNLGLHTGRVVSAELGPKAFNAELSLAVESDSWTAGGRARFTVSLQAQPDGTYVGTYTGTFRGQKREGEASLRAETLQPIAPGFQALAASEHPRILFRAADLPALRARAQTPFGQLCLERMGGRNLDGLGPADAIGAGLRYQLTGDAEWAAKAREFTEQHMADQTGGALAIGRLWGPRQEQVAIAYDLCYHAWPPEFRRKVEGYLRWVTGLVFTDQVKLSRTINWHVASNYAGPIYSGSAFAGLALLGEQGPAPVQPPAPAEFSAVAPLAGSVPEGVPVVPFQFGRSFDRWLATQALPFATNLDPMETLDGLESASIAPGTKVTYDEHELVFQALEEKHLQPDKGGISLATGLKPGPAVTCFFYTVVDNPEPRQVKVRAPFSKAGRVQVVLNGRRVEHEQIIQLDKGLYPLLVGLRLGAKWGSLEPWFEPVTEADLAAAKIRLEARRAEHEEALADWRAEMDEWTRNGNLDTSATRIFERSRFLMRLFGDHATGRGGYQAESGGYFLETLPGPGRYYAAYQRVFGRPLNPGTVDAYLPRVLSGTVFAQGVKPYPQGISAHVDPGSRHFANLFPLVAPAWRGPVLWYWNLVGGGDPLAPDLAKIAGSDPVHAFLTYPLDLKPVAPSEASLPLTWVAPDFGHYTLRNAHRGADDIVFQALGRFAMTGGWGGPDAGAFRLRGLGQTWAIGNESREVHPFLESRVLFPDNPEFDQAQEGLLVHQNLLPDGSGQITFDLSRATLLRGDKRPPTLFEPYGFIRRVDQVQPAARHLRAFGIDYSGKSGAPALLVIVDDIQGAKTKLWNWQLEDPAIASPAPGGFVLTQGDATLRGHFVSPTSPTIDIGSRTFSAPKGAGSNAGKPIKYPVKWVSATAGEDGRFFFVATLQRGPAPEISVKGEGLNAVVSVGSRKVRYDGTKVVFE